jgi:hypothetical protein
MDERIARLLTPALQDQPKQRISEKATSVEVREEKEEGVPLPKAA